METIRSCMESTALAGRHIAKTCALPKAQNYHTNFISSFEPKKERKHLRVWSVDLNGRHLQPVPSLSFRCFIKKENTSALGAIPRSKCGVG